MEINDFEVNTCEQINLQDTLIAIHEDYFWYTLMLCLKNIF